MTVDPAELDPEGARLKALGTSLARHWLDRTVADPLDPALTMQDAEHIRAAMLAKLMPILGQPAGFKISAITPPAQRDLGVSDPLSGVYLSGMMRIADTSTITLNVDYGVRPIVEAKLLLAVRDESINGATAPEEVAAGIAYVLPSIELGDSLLPASQPLTGPVLTAYNVGARGVLIGRPIPFDTIISALRDLVVTTTDQHGRVLERETGVSMMGDPLRAAAWVVQEQNRRGVTLRAGDRLGLGALSRVRPTAGLLFDTTWEGLEAEPFRMGVQFQ